MKSKIECRHCGRMATIATLRASHGASSIWCRYRKSIDWMHANDYTTTSNRSQVFELAGVSKMLPIVKPNYHIRMPSVDPATGAGCLIWVEASCMNFEAVTPMWAWRLNEEMLNNQEVIAPVMSICSKRKVYKYRRTGEYDRQLENLDRREQIKRNYVKKELKRVDFKIPIEMRATVIRSAANNPMMREMMFDDLPAAMTILMGSL